MRVAELPTPALVVDTRDALRGVAGDRSKVRML